MKGCAEFCENCGKPAVMWSGRSRKYFRAETVVHTCLAGWCSQKCMKGYANPTPREVERLFKESLRAKPVKVEGPEL